MTRVEELKAELAETKRELASYKEAVADQFHYDMQAILTGTPENRMANELSETKRELEEARQEMADAAAECGKEIIDRALSAMRGTDGKPEPLCPHRMDASSPVPPGCFCSTSARK